MFVYKRPLKQIITDGLINYWPIENDLTDYIGSSNLSPGTNLVEGGSVSFGKNRFNQTNSSIYLNNGYYTISPGGVYFNGDFTVLAWISVVNYVGFSRLIDFGNGPSSNNIIISFTDSTSGKPLVQLYSDNTAGNKLTSSIPLSLNNWYHLGVVLSGTNLYIYENGIEVASQSNAFIPQNVMRSSCFIGRSNWYPSDADANAYVDELKIYNRALSLSEIQFDMSLSN